MRPLLVIIAAYLIGSIPFGYLIVRHKMDADIRETGSGGTGATNVSRRAGKAAGVFTLVLDALKGSVAVLVARVLLSDGQGPIGSWLRQRSRRSWAIFFLCGWDFVVARALRLESGSL